jgi:hypothetical protein
MPADELTHGCRRSANDLFESIRQQVLLMLGRIRHLPEAHFRHRHLGNVHKGFQITLLSSHGAQARSVSMAPNQVLMIRGGAFAMPLDEAPVGIKQKLRVVKRSAVSLIDAD